MITSQQTVNVDIGGSTPNAPLLGNHAIGNWTITPVTTPEPGTISLLLLGMAGVGLLVRRKRLPPTTEIPEAPATFPALTDKLNDGHFVDERN